MHALTKGALGVAALALLGAPPRLYEPAPAALSPRVDATSSASSVPQAAWRCPPRSVPEEIAPGVWTCLALPALDAQLDARTRRLAEMPPTPAYLKMTAPTESIPRLPERPEDYAAYQLPVDPAISVGAALGSEARSGERPRLGVRLVTEADTPVTLVDLEGEIDRPEVLLVGELYGVTVVVKHRVQRVGQEGEREYLVFYGNLARPGPNVISGSSLGPLAVVGFVGDGEEDAPSVYFEVRQQQRALAGPAEHLSQLVSKSVAVDARNVLPLIPKPSAQP